MLSKKMDICNKYDRLKSNIIVTITLNKKITEPTTILMDFPFKIVYDPYLNDLFGNDINITYDKHISYVSIKILPNKNYGEYRWFFKGDIMRRYSDSEQYCYITCGSISGDIPFPISYSFIRPEFSNCTIDGTQPIQESYSYEWDDIRSSKINNPTLIKISTSLLSQLWQVKIIIGTTLLSISISYLVSMLYSYLNDRSKGFINQEKNFD